MAKLLKLRRGTTSQHSSFTGAEGEVTVDTTKDTIVVHDGSTAGGTALAKESDNLSLIDEDNLSTNSATRPPSQQSVKAYVDALPDVIDEDNLGSDSSTRPPSQQSVKAYADTKAPSVLDEDNLGSDSATRPPSQQSVKAYVDGQTLSLIDEDNLGSDAANRPPSQQSVKAYVDAADATKAPLANPTFTGTVNAAALTLSGNLQVNGTTTTVASSTMTVADKNIEIAKGAANDAAADGAGITVDSGEGDKTWNWVNATDAWTSSEHIHLGDNKELKLGTGSDFKLYHNGSHSRLLDSGNGKIQFGSDTGIEVLTENFATQIALFDTTQVLLKENTSVTGTLSATSTVSDSKGNLRSIPYQDETGSTHTLIAADAGKAVGANNGVTIPASVLGAGDAVTIICHSGSDITLTQGSGLSLYNTADASTGNRTLAARGMATIYFVSGTIAYISGSQLT